MRSCEAVVPPVEGGEAEEVDLIVVVSMSCKKKSREIRAEQESVGCSLCWILAVGRRGWSRRWKWGWWRLENKKGGGD